MKKILIFGAGSIGNHMSYASTKLGHKVFITDKDPFALKRMKNTIYPKRYGRWDKKIIQINFDDLRNLKEKFDLIIVGIPPKFHLEILDFCKKNIFFKKILIEKPLCVYYQNFKRKDLKDKKIFSGYNHSISQSFLYFLGKLKIANFNKMVSLEANWKEGWYGILNAHFWMNNEFDSYLGNVREGGGALHEHSHGLHLLIILLKQMKISLNSLNFKRNIFFKNQKTKKYDYFGAFVASYKGKIIKYETDLITFPSKKEIRVNYHDKSIIWKCNFKKGIDLVRVISNQKVNDKVFKKTRSSEFENEIRHILSANKKYNGLSNLDMKYSIATMKCIKSLLENEK